MPSILEQLKAIQAAMPEGAEVSLNVSSRTNFLLQKETMPPGQTEVLIAVGRAVQSFYVDDWEWEKGEGVAGEIIGLMTVIIEEKGLA